MRATDSKLERQVQFWSLLGPFFILLTLFISFTKPSPANIQLGLIALAAIPICWKWKMFGLAGIIGVLAAVITYNYSELSHVDRFWQLGVGIALSVGCVVTTLSFEEAESLIQGLKVQSDSRLDNLWHLDEKLKTLNEKYETEKQALATELETALKGSQRLKLKVITQEKLSKIHHEELKSAQMSRSKLLEEVHEARTLISALEEQVEKLTHSIQLDKEHNAALRTQVEQVQVSEMTADAKAIDKLLRQSEGKYRQLSRQFKEKSDILDATRKELFVTEEKLLALKQENKEQQVYMRNEVIDKLERHIITLNEELERQDQEIEQLESLISTL